MKFIPQASPWISDDDVNAVADSIRTTFLSEHKQAAQFVAKIQEFTGAEYAVLAPNGTIALALALKAMGIGYGDEVIVPTMTFMASATAVEMVGGIPIICDIDESCQIDVKSCEHLVGPRTRAIMPVHLWGLSANMTEVMQFAKQHELKVLEDTAQSLGTTWQDKMCGTIGDAGTFSFFVDKVITTGEGGAVITNDKHIYEEMLYIRNVGRKDRGSFNHPRIGYNFRMTDMQCAMGNVQMDKLNTVIYRKREIYKMYRDQLHGYCGSKIIQPIPGSGMVPFRGALLLDHKAGKLLSHLRQNEIQERGFFKPLHIQQPFMNQAHAPVAEEMWKRGVCLPTHLMLTDNDVQRIIDVVKDYFHQRERAEQRKKAGGIV